MKLEPRGTRPMPWISDERAGPPGPHGGEQPSEERIRCDLCSWETANAYWGPKNARAEAGVWWPKAEEHQGEGEPGWCPRCASRESDRARWSYHCTSLDVESVMSEFWRAPTGRAVVPGNTVAKSHPGRVPPKAPPPGISSLATEERLAAWAGDALTREALSRHDYLLAKGHPGCVPPKKASPPGIPSLSTKERLAALEEEVAKLRLRVAQGRCASTAMMEVL